jgi:hypothetical protein
MGGGAFAATGDSLRKIVVFQAGTSVQVQQQVVAQSGSRLLNILSLINAVTIELPTQNAPQALGALQADPTVAGGTMSSSSLLPTLLLRSSTPGDWMQSISPMCIKRIQVSKGLE